MLGVEGPWNSGVIVLFTSRRGGTCDGQKGWESEQESGGWRFIHGNPMHRDCGMVDWDSQWSAEGLPGAFLASWDGRRLSDGPAVLGGKEEKFEARLERMGLSSLGVPPTQTHQQPAGELRRSPPGACGPPRPTLTLRNQRQTLHTSHYTSSYMRSPRPSARKSYPILRTLYIRITINSRMASRSLWLRCWGLN